MSKNKLGNLGDDQIINVQAYKYDGTLYRQWNGVKVIEVSPNILTLFMYKTKVQELNNQRWVVREPMLWSFPRHGFYNTTGMIRKSGVHYYTNIASPPIFEDGTLKYIDFDLDIKAYPGEKIKIVDKQEFERHKVLYGYPKNLLTRIEKTTSDVIKKINYQDDIFDKDVIDTFISSLVDEKELAKKFLKFNFD